MSEDPLEEPWNGDLSESGAPILRHDARLRPFEPAADNDASLAQITAHMEAHLGPVALVYHEIVSDLVHVDVHVLAPTAQRPYFTLVTSGMSDRPMSPASGAEECRYAELMLCLPPTWPIALQPGQVETFDDETHFWPIRWLKLLARFPHEYDTWLWWGHSVPNGDPPEPFAANTRLSGVLLSTPVLAPPEFAALPVREDKTIHFFSVLPLYPEEMAYKLRHGAETLLDKLDRSGISELLEIDRKSVCRRSPWTF